MELITCPLISVPHGFPTRAGGVSTGAFASLSCSTAVGDSAANVEENLRRLAAAAQVEPRALLTVSQVHGAAVVEGRAASAAINAPIAEADALWTGEEGVAVGVKTADCLPILLEDRVGRRVAAVHAGWRGVIAEIVARALEAMMAHGTRPADVRVAIGPAIQRCCFEVDGDLPARFASAFGDDVVVRVEGKDKPRLDLPLAVSRTLARLGVPDGHVARLPQCTMCDTRFFSHRRDRGVTGRHLSFISCRFASGL